MNMEDSPCVHSLGRAKNARSLSKDLFVMKPKVTCYWSNGRPFQSTRLHSLLFSRCPTSPFVLYLQWINSMCNIVNKHFTFYGTGHMGQQTSALLSRPDACSSPHISLQQTSLQQGTFNDCHFTYFSHLSSSKL